MNDLPSGTVTFLFTDIEGSTRLWQEHPETMRVVLARHDELLRAAIESDFRKIGESASMHSAHRFALASGYRVDSYDVHPR